MERWSILGTYLEDMLISFWRFVPGVFFCWIFALVAPNPIALYGLLVLIALPTFCTGASKALGHYPGGQGTGKQLGVMLSLLLLPVVIFIIALLLVSPLSGRIETYTLLMAATGFSLLLFGLLMFRFWPAYAAAFTTAHVLFLNRWQSMGLVASLSCDGCVPISSGSSDDY